LELALNERLQNPSSSDEVETHQADKHLRPRAVLDLSYSKLRDKPLLLEDRLRLYPGILAAEINVFSGRIKVEFDPSQTTIEKVRHMILTVVASKK